MNDLQSKTVEIDEKQISIYIDELNKEIWVSLNGLSTLYGKSKPTISKQIKKIKELFHVFPKNETTEAKMETTGQDGKAYFVNFYSSFWLEKIDEKYNSIEGKRLYDLCFENNNIPSNAVPLENYEIVRYSQGNFSVDVHISEDDKNIWMNQDEIATLFETTQPNISMHISNILEDKELDERIYKEFLYMASNGRQYSTVFYNLDMILAIGYRVRTSRAILFRNWASKILKNYMIKGYAVNEDKIKELELQQALNTNKIYELEDKLDKLEQKNIIFYKNRGMDAYAFLAGIIEMAKRSIVYIDPYADRFTLKVLSFKNKQVPAVVVSRTRFSKEEIELFRKTSGVLVVIRNKENHDRYLIIDKEICFDIGGSVTTIAVHDFHVTKVINQNYIEELIEKYVKLDEIGNVQI